MRKAIVVKNKINGGKYIDMICPPEEQPAPNTIKKTSTSVSVSEL